MPVYAAVRLGREPCECERLHEPVGGWVWVRCPDLGALLREVARSLLSGFEPLVATPRGLLDPLEAEVRLRELEEPVLNGCYELLALGGGPAKLLELGAVSLKWRPESPKIEACFGGTSVARLLEHGFVPLVWAALSSFNAGLQALPDSA